MIYYVFGASLWMIAISFMTAGIITRAPIKYHFGSYNLVILILQTNTWINRKFTNKNIFSKKQK